jgi:hypothetical protein
MKSSSRANAATHLFDPSDRCRRVMRERRAVGFLYADVTCCYL